MIHYCIPTIRRFDLLEQCIESIVSGSLVPDIIHIIDNSGGKLPIDMFGRNQTILKSCQQIKVYTPQKNLGVAGSWNYFFDVIGEDTIILSNDDVRVSHNCVEALIHEYNTSIRHSMFHPAGQGENIYSLFLLKYHAWKLVGRFDENFFPAYFEDNDYDFRRKLYGLKSLRVEAATYEHVGSATLKSYTNHEMNQHHENFRKNEEYYRRKWKAPCGSEPERKYVNEPI